jgi:hypothetical protein
VDEDGGWPLEVMDADGNASEIYLQENELVLYEGARFRYSAYTIHPALYIIHYTPCAIHYTLYTLRYTLYTIHCILSISYTTDCTLCSYTIHCTLYVVPVCVCLLLLELMCLHTTSLISLSHHTTTQQTKARPADAIRRRRLCEHFFSLFAP